MFFSAWIVLVELAISTLFLLLSRSLIHKAFRLKIGCIRQKSHALHLPDRGAGSLISASLAGHETPNRQKEWKLHETN
jgi:hypothetical protein